MPGTLPTSKSFPHNINLTITPPPPTHPPTNILILLHGLGDTHASFNTLARQLSLPETACLTLQAATPLPFDLGGFHWGDDILFDQASGTMDVDTGFTKSTRLIKEGIIQESLMDRCGYQSREIMLFGYGQGGMAALAAAASLDAEQELGGVISVGGPLPSSVSTVLPGKVRTPVLVLGGFSNSLVTASAVARLKDVFETVEYKAWKKSGDGMPTSREEMLPIMQFFAQRLRSRRGVPEGSVEADWRLAGKLKGCMETVHRVPSTYATRSVGLHRYTVSTPLLSSDYETPKGIGQISVIGEKRSETWLVREVLGVFDGLYA